ncbi:MAG: glycosyltransferase [Chloroflexi bacterium]|nr:glycosyltransferase [Chloroflexota bacterium]
MRLSVVLGTYNRREQLLRCLESIFAQTRTPVKVYVTDAGSTDGTVDLLRERASDRFIPVLVGEKLGQARAYNDVFRIVDTPYVAWLSDDNVVVNRSLDVAVRILDRARRVGMVGLKVRDRIGPFVDAPYLGAVSKLGVLNVNQGVLRTSVLQGVGGFSEAFRDYGIDPDLTAKVLFSGYDVVYTRGVAIHHYRNWSGGAKITPAERERQKRFMAMYERKWGSLVDDDPIWRAKKRLWVEMQRRLGVNINSHRYILGQVCRDWCNILTARYISPLDPLLTAGRPYHLVQRVPRNRRLRALPPEPALETVA